MYARTTGCYGHAAGTQAVLVLEMHRRETITTLECFPIQDHLHSYDSKAPLGLRVVACSLHSDQIASESSLPARGREHMGPRLASSCVNATPECWARPAATACFPHKMMRSDLSFSCRWEERHTQSSSQPAAQCCRTSPWHFYLFTVVLHHILPQPLYTYHISRRTLIIDCPQYWTMLHCFVDSWVLKGLQSCGLWSGFHICPAGQMLRSRPFGNHANISYQRKYASSAVKALKGKLLRNE